MKFYQKIIPLLFVASSYQNKILAVLNTKCKKELKPFKDCEVNFKNSSLDNVLNQCEKYNAANCRQFYEDPYKYAPSCVNLHKFDINYPQSNIFNVSEIDILSNNIICDTDENGDICPFANYLMDNKLLDAIEDNCHSKKCTDLASKYFKFYIDNTFKENNFYNDYLEYVLSDECTIQASKSSKSKCDIECTPENRDCSTGINQIFFHYNDKECYISDFTAGKEDDSVSSIGNDFTNETSDTLVNRIEKMKYQINGWLYCYDDDNVAQKHSKIRLENFGSHRVIDSAKEFLQNYGNKKHSYSSKPISYATVFSYDPQSASIEDDEIRISNQISYYDEDDELVDTVTVTLYYKVYIGEDSWSSC
ncbi:hypothetical protein PIROE2DRAFT_6824 [Piromyces sp. E2]|nr:hypothetical protein PIROE2DRAFT_6824 [Piromyces sp. E2]|eukprot:OUM66026.1 hypothetical protein PIROE2DRAFT_6824 [Piromyces sp. E2]